MEGTFSPGSSGSVQLNLEESIFSILLRMVSKFREHMRMMCAEVAKGLFFLFRATPMAYGGSQARGPNGAIDLAYITATATWDPSCICDLTL